MFGMFAIVPLRPSRVLTGRSAEAMGTNLGPSTARARRRNNAKAQGRSRTLDAQGLRLQAA